MIRWRNLLEYIKENVKEYFSITKTNKEGNITCTFITFENKYIQEENFRNKLNNTYKKYKKFANLNLKNIFITRSNKCQTYQVQ